MSWTQLATDRWSMADAEGDARHLLLRANARSVEFHGTTVHVYDGPDEVVDPAFPLGVPGTDEHRPTWVMTELRPGLAAASDDGVWAALADPRYAEAAVDPEPAPQPTADPPAPRARAPRSLPED